MASVGHSSTPYTVTTSPAASRDIKKLKNNRIVLESVARTIRDLKNDPRPPGAEQLAPNCYRVRDGEYRIVYTVDDSVREVLIAAVKDRKEVYKH